MASETTRTITCTVTLKLMAATYGGIVRPANRKEDRVDRRLLFENRSDKRRVVVAMRQRKGRTLTGVFADG